MGRMVCPIPRVSSFLVCMDLKTGTIILGITNLVVAVILAFLSLFLLIADVGVTLFTQTSEDFKSKAGLSISQGVMYAEIFSIIILVVVLLISVLYIVISSALIIGAKTGQPGFLFPWIILTCVSIFLDVIIILGSLISGFIPTVIIGLIFLGIGVYFFLVVWSFRM